MVRRCSSLLAILALAASPLSRAANDACVPAADLDADLLRAYTTLQRAHADLYVQRSQDEYDAFLLRTLRDTDGCVPRDEALLTLQRLLAFGRVAHARVDEASAAYRAYRSSGPVFPLPLRFIEGRAYAATAAGALLPGDELLAVDDHPVAGLRERAWTYLSADTPYMLDSLLEFAWPRVLWTELGARPSFTVDFRRGRQTHRTTVTAAAAPAAMAATRGRDPDARIARMLDGGIAYLQPGPFYEAAEDAPDPYDARAFTAFIDAAFARFGKAHARALLIDLRDNPGGDSSFSDPMVAWFATRPFRFASAFRIRVSPETVASNQARLASSGTPDGGVSRRLAQAYAAPGATVEFPVPEIAPRTDGHFDAPVFVLVNRHTYSNAVFVAALVQDYRFGIILGEETSDLASTLGAMETFALPHTGARVGYPKAELLRPSGERTRRGVVPDQRIDEPLSADPAGDVLRAALATIRRRLR
jgi:hypothetical protein